MDARSFPAKLAPFLDSVCLFVRFNVGLDWTDLFVFI